MLYFKSLDKEGKLQNEEILENKNIFQKNLSNHELRATFELYMMTNKDKKPNEMKSLKDIYDSAGKNYNYENELGVLSSIHEL